MSTAADVARAFDLGVPLRDLSTVARGAMGEVFRLDTGRGPFAVKLLFEGPTGGEDANAALQLAAHSAGVNMPLPLPATSGSWTADIGAGSTWRAYEWVDGVHPPDHEPLGSAIVASVAANLGRLHALKFDTGEPVHSWFLGAVDEEVEHALRTAEAAGIDVSGARRVLPELAAISRMVSPEQPIGCHNDPDRTNAFVRGDGSTVLIDWDNAGACFAQGELLIALWSWGLGWTADAESLGVVVATMVRSYRDAGGVFEPSGLEAWAWVCSSWVNYAIECCGHLGDPNVSAETLGFERPLIEQLAHYPVSVAKLERLLEMVPA